MKNSLPLKVLHQNRKRDIWLGGDVVQMNKTMEELGKLGVDVSFNDQPLFKPALMLSTFDIVHVWNFSMLWTKYQFWAAKRQNRKVVCSMIYHQTEAYIPRDFQQIMADNMDAMIFLTKGEVERARKVLTIPDEKVHIIPNGIDSFWLTTPKKKYWTQGYVLTVGRLDGSKGQLEVAKACKELRLQYLCAGELNNEGYAKQVEEAGGILIGSIPHEDLIPLYDNASVHVLASMGEIYPLVVMEAGARKLNSVVTDTCEWKDIPNVTWCKHEDVESIKLAIQKSLKIKKDSKFRNKLKRMTWESVAKQVLKVYNSIT